VLSTVEEIDMAGWLVPALKAVLPHVGTIITAAAPVFTRRSADPDAAPTTLVQQQIAELQAAAAQNDAHVRELAEQLQTALSALERSAALAERRLSRTTWIASAAVAAAAVALATALFALAGG